MSKILRSCFAVLCIVALSLTVAGMDALAEDGQEAEPMVFTYSPIPLYLDDEYLGVGMKSNETTYVPLLAFCELLYGKPLDVSWDQELGLVEISAEGITISQTVGDNYMIANGRYLYLPNGVFNINGTIIVSIREVCKIFGYEVVWNDEYWTILLEDSDKEILESGDTFYDEEDLYWLSRVISSESGNQPLEGMIGVGNVVINRAKEENTAFPDTIYDVIYQPGQFAVADTGAVKLEPRECAVVAAKLCLEGYNTVEDCLYFHNPAISTTQWFRKHKTYYTTIEDHEFFA